MGDTVPVSVGWALWGKHPGTSRDYSVLASSADPLSEQEFASVLTHFVPGTPPTEPGQPGSLPWVTISRVGVAQQAYLGISIQNATGTVDGAARPITSTSYFCIPYAAVQDAPVSYASLYQQLADVDLPCQNGSLIQLAVPRLDPQAVAAGIIREFGEAEVAAAAAMVLSGTVSVVGSEGSTLDARLRFLDAVAALLPYGYRTAYTASTWSDSGTRHPIRIAFASRPRQDAAVVRWGAAAAAVTGAAGEAYLRLLRQVRQQLPAEDQLAALISSLARDAVPCNFDQPQRAVDGLRAFALPFLVREAVRDGTADPVEVREVFLRSRAGDLAPDERQGLFGWLISTAGRQPQNWDVIRDWWDRVADGQPLVMLPALVQAVRDLLWTPSPSLSIREHMTLATSRHIIDPLLAGLIAAPGSRSDFLSGRGAVAQQVADRVRGEPGPAALPQTRQALADNPLVTCELLAQLAGNERELQSALGWLEPVLPDLLAPFRIVLGRAPGEVSEGAIQQLAERDREYVALLLTAAAYRRRLDLVLPGFARWLARNAMAAAGPPASEPARYWRDRIGAVSPAGPDSAAWLDLALLASGNDPRFMLERRDQVSRERYTVRLVHSWLTLVRDLGPAAGVVLTRTLAGYLREERWLADAAQAIVVTDVVRQLTRDDQESPLWVVTANVLRRTPQAENWRFAQDFRPAGRPERRSAGQPAGQQPPREPWHGHSPPEQDWRPLASGDRSPTLAALRQLGPGATAVEIAQAVTEAFRDDLSLPDVGRAVAGSGAIHSGAQALATLEELHRALLATPGKRSTVEAWLAGFARGFADGTFGEQTADEFRSLAIRSSVLEIAFHVGVLHIVAADRDQDSVVKLFRALSAVEDSLRGGGKRQGRRGIHLRGKGGDVKDEPG